MKALEATFKKKKKKKRKQQATKKAEAEPEGDETKEEEDGLDDIFSQLKKRKKSNNASDQSNTTSGRAQQGTYAMKGKTQSSPNLAVGTEGEDDWFSSRSMRQSGEFVEITRSLP